MQYWHAWYFTFCNSTKLQLGCTSEQLCSTTYWIVALCFHIIANSSKYRSLRTGVVSSGVEIGVHALLSFTPLPRSKSQIFTGDTWNGVRRKNTYKSNHWGNKLSLMKSKQVELLNIDAPYWEIHRVYSQVLDLDVQYLRSNTERQWVMSKTTMPKIEKIFAFWCLQ